MRLPEQRLWDRMRRNAPKDVKLARIENLVEPGWPDVHAIAQGRVVWMELKSIGRFPVRATTRVFNGKSGLSPVQRNWHLDWQRNGGTSCVIGAVGVKALFLVSGQEPIDQFNSMTQQDLWPFSTTWDGVFEFLGAERK